METAQYWPAFIIAANLLFILFTLSVERKNSSMAVSWILLLIFLPVAGFILYLLFGTNIFIRKKELFRLKRTQDDTLAANCAALLPKKNENVTLVGELIRFNERLGSGGLSIYNDVRLFFTAEEKYGSLLDDIEQAREHIHMQYFIFRGDLIGRLILAALEKKARAGVQVRILYDHGGSIFTPSSVFRHLKMAGAEVAAFLPLSAAHYVRINFRNHRKLVIIDGQIAYTGGMNIGDEYMSRYKARRIKWRDTHLRVYGDSVAYMQLQFVKDWQFATGRLCWQTKGLFKTGLTANRLPMEIISSGPDTAEDAVKWNFLKLIYGARESILLQSPYFVPDDTFMEALKIAALSGCRIRILTPRISDNYIVQQVSLDYLGELLAYGVEVKIYDGFLHAKMLVVDQAVVSLGSANLDMRSFSLNFELNAFLYDSQTVAACCCQFEQDATEARSYTLEEYRRRSWLKKAQNGLFRLLAPLM